MQTKTLLATVNRNAGNTSYQFPFLYLRKEFVKVMRLHTDGTRTVLVYHQDYEVEGNYVILNAVGTLTDTIRIYRETPTDQIITDYVDASILKAYDLNVRDIQLLHILEEAMDFVNLYALLVDPEDNCWDALSRRLKNLADPVDPHDATNKKYVNEEDEKIMTFIRRYCMLLDEEANRWEARHKAIMHVYTPTEDDHATNKLYVDTIKRQLGDRISALEQTMAGLEQVLAEMSRAIASNAQGIADLWAALRNFQGVDKDALKEEIIEELTVKVEKPTLSEVQHTDELGQERWYVYLVNCDYDAVNVNGPTDAMYPGTYTITCSLKPMYAWSDGTNTPISFTWTAVSENQVISVNSIETDGPTAALQGTHPVELTGELNYNYVGGEHSNWTEAPIKTFHLSFSKPYTKLQTEGMGESHEEGDTFNFNVTSADTNESVPGFQITVGHDYVRIESLGVNMSWPESINVFTDDDMNHKLVLGFQSSGYTVNEEFSIKLGGIITNGVAHDISRETEYALVLDNTEANDYTKMNPQKLIFDITGSYGMLYAKNLHNEEVVQEGFSMMMEQWIDGGYKEKCIVTVGHDYVEITGLCNSDNFSNFLVYADDKEDKGFTVSVKTRGFANEPVEPDVPTLEVLNENYPQIYTDNYLMMAGSPTLRVRVNTNSDGDITVDGIPEKWQPTITYDKSTKIAEISVGWDGWTERYTAEQKANEYCNLNDEYRSDPSSCTVRIRTEATSNYTQSQYSSNSIPLVISACANLEWNKSDGKPYNRLNIAYYNNGTKVWAGCAGTYATIEEGTNSATDIGQYTVRATPNEGYYWRDGTTGMKEFPWEVVNYKPLNTGNGGFSNGNSPYYGYGVKGGLYVTKNKDNAPMPTFRVLPTSYANDIEIVESEQKPWNGNSQPGFVVTNKSAAGSGNTEIYIEVNEPETQYTGPQTMHFNVGKLKPKAEAGYVTLGTLSRKVSASPNNYSSWGQYVHGELPDVSQWTIDIADPTIASLTVSTRPTTTSQPNYEYQGDTRGYIQGYLTPLKVGSTSVTITIPETTHYRRIQVSATITITE